MTKSTKHKKEFRKEKNKIKLKLSALPLKSERKKKGVFLPKGLNITDTSFKSKKIVLPDHLRPTEESGLPLTKKKQTFKELLSHMSHFNTSVQQDGINGMKELLVKYPKQKEINLGLLLSKLSELAAARESSVRKCALKLLEQIIQSTPQDKISPFFPLLNAQLMCSMNHIALDIQKDSHLLLDLLLLHAPNLVSAVTMQILPNFLEQISCRDDSKTGKRILAINPNQRLTSLKWRQEVLTRIHHLLVLLLPNKETTSTSIDHSTTIIMSGKSHQICPLYTKRNFDLKLDIQQAGYVSIKEMTSSSQQVKEFASHLLPLLMETWIEALASEQLNKTSSRSEGSLIGKESCSLLTCVVNVLFSLWSVLNSSDNRIELLNWFEQQCGESLIRNFVQCFPFSARIESGQQRNKTQLDLVCREQNIVLCFLWAQLGVKNAAKYAPDIFQYLCGVFQSAENQPLTAIELEQLRNILNTTSAKKSLLAQTNRVIEAATEFSIRVRSDRKDRLHLNRFLLEVGQNFNQLESLPALKNWIENCPTLIRQDGNGALLGAINRVVSRNATSMKVAREQIPHLMERFENYGISYDHWNSVFDFFYWTWLPDDDRNILTFLQGLIDRLEDPLSKSYGSGVLDAIVSKS